jgi:hypothetical protein
MDGYLMIESNEKGILNEVFSVVTILKMYTVYALKYIVIKCVTSALLYLRL